jgi:hypothetical protein
MAGLDYTSVATVALHINNLIRRGHLRKRDHSARSLEVVTASQAANNLITDVKPGEEKWLVDKIERLFIEKEKPEAVFTESELDNLYVLIGALKVLGLDGAAQSFIPRLVALKKRVIEVVH